MAIIYLAGKMSGVKNWNIRAFRKAEKRLSRQGHTVLNPASHTPMYKPESISHEQYMTIALAMLDCCDTIYMLRGWESSVGANKELNKAVSHRKEVWFERDRARFTHKWPYVLMLIALWLGIAGVVLFTDYLLDLARLWGWIW